MAEQVKPGDKVICVDNDGAAYVLTIGKEYEVININDDFVWVTDDHGDQSPCYQSRFKLAPQSILIDGVETYLATAEELAKDWEGKEIQDGSKWLEIVGARTEINNGYTTFDYADGRWVLYSDQLIPYRLAPKKKTLRDVVYNTTSLFEGYDNLLRKTDAERIVSAIEENFEVTPKQGEINE